MLAQHFAANRFALNRYSLRTEPFSHNAHLVSRVPVDTKASEILFRVSSASQTSKLKMLGKTRPSHHTRETHRTFSVPLTSKTQTGRGGPHFKPVPISLRRPSGSQRSPGQTEDASNTTPKSALRTWRMRGAGSALRGASSESPGARRSAWNLSPARVLRPGPGPGPAYLGRCLTRLSRRSLCESAASGRK